MDLPTLTLKLTQITGPWRALPGATAADLDAARAALALALALNQTDDTGHPILAQSPALLESFIEQIDLNLAQHLRDLAAAALAAADRNPPLSRVFLRAQPVRLQHDVTSVPTWAVGVQPGSSYGPFANLDDRPLWVDVYPPGALVRVLRGTDPTPVLLLTLPAAAVKADKGYTLPAGSVWIRSNLLHPDAIGYTGLRIKSGSLLLSEMAGVPAGVSNPPIVLTGTTTATLTIQTDPPALPPIGGGGTGQDGARAQVVIPPTATFQFAPTGTTLTAAGDGSMKAYGTKIDLKRSAAPLGYTGTLHQIVVPYQATPSSFTVVSVASKLFQPAGTAPIVQGAWLLPVAAVDPAALSVADSAGTVAIVTGPGLGTTWQGLGGMAVPATGASVLGVPGRIEVIAAVSNPRARQSYALWQETKGIRSSMEVRYPVPFQLVFASQVGLDALYTGGVAVGHIDRPLAADGGRLSLALPGVFAQLDGGGPRQSILVTQIAAPQTCLPLCLSNALLRCTPPVRMVVTALLDNKDQAQHGTLTLDYFLRAVQPLLPDPYAANVGQVQHEDGSYLGLFANAVRWSAPNQPRLEAAVLVFGSAQVTAGVGEVAARDTAHASARLPPVHDVFAHLHPPEAPAGVELVPAMPAALPPSAVQLPAAIAPLAVLRALFEQTAGRGAESWKLLDLSSRADLFGVGVALPAPPVGMTVRNLSLVALGQSLRLFTVPGISWEPVRTIKGPPPPEAQIANPFVFPDDGGPTVVGANTVHLVPMAPQPLFDDIVAAIDGGATGAAMFTLPFGMWATAQVHKPGAVMTGIRPQFSAPKLDGGLQLSLQNHGAALINTEDPTLPGAAVQLSTLQSDGKDENVLGDSVQNIFNGNFFSPGSPPGHAPRVPLSRIDFSGYGSSMFSHWQSYFSPPPPLISKAHFDVLIGRVSREVVQAKSILYPWGVPVVRTITIYRDGGGGIYREDTGWQASGPGVYAIPGLTFHPGAVLGVFSVRNIAELGEHYQVDKGDPNKNVDLIKVQFDADALVLNVKNGGQDRDFVPSRGMLGYVQLAPRDGAVLPVDLAALLISRGPLGGPVSALYDIGGSGQKIRAVRVEVDAAPDDSGTSPQFAAAVRGQPVLPKEGAWSMARKRAAVNTPEALDPNFAVPVIKRNDPGTPWRLADPFDLIRTSAVSDYGLLQGTGPQRMFVQQPVVAEGKKALTTALQPVMADVSALLSATGIFPKLVGTLFQLVDTASQFSLDVAGGGLKFGGVADPTGTYRKTLSPRASRDLLNLGFIRLYLDFADDDAGSHLTQLSATLSPGGWAVVFSPLSFVLDVGPFLGIVRVTGMARASTGQAPQFTGLAKDPSQPFGATNTPKISFSGALSALTDVMRALQDLAKAIGLDLGGLDVSFAGNKLTVLDSFALPDIPLGIGTISGVTLRLGAALTLPDHLEFVAGINAPDNPFKWIVSPLAGNGAIQLAAKDNNHDIVVKGGLGLGLALDIGIAKGSASIILSAELDVGTAAIALKGTLTGQAGVDVLGGLASASLTLSATLGIQYLMPSAGHSNGQIDLFADVSVGIHISICWVIDIDFDGSWQFDRAFDANV
jgi:hypothetical protein